MAILKIEFPDNVLTLDRKPIKKVLRQAGAEVAKAARGLIRKSQGGGRTYTVGGKKITASAPGEAPVSRTGELARRIGLKLTKSGLTVKIVDSAGMDKKTLRRSYAVALEAGAKGGGGRNSKGKTNYALRKATGNKLATTTMRILLPRPFLTTALAMKEGDIAPRIKAAIMLGIEFKPRKGGTK